MNNDKTWRSRGGLLSRKMVQAVLFILVLPLASSAAPLKNPERPAVHLAPASLVFAGSGTNVAIVRLLATAFEKRHPGITIRVPASIGSGGAISAVADRAIALGLSSRPLKANEKVLGLKELPFARTALVFCAYKNVPEDNLTREELLKIYEGVKTRWRDGTKIVLLTREPGDTTIAVLAEKIAGFSAVYRQGQEGKRWVTLYTDQEMNKAVARTAGGLGISDYGSLTAEKHEFRLLRFEGIAPTPDNVRSGRYPLSKDLTFVYREEELHPAARAFMDFVRSPEGRKIMSGNNYVPL